MAALRPAHSISTKKCHEFKCGNRNRIYFCSTRRVRAKFFCCSRRRGLYTFFVFARLAILSRILGIHRIARWYQPNPVRRSM